MERKVGRSSRRSLAGRLLRSRVYPWFAAPLVLLGLWLPGFWQGDFRTDSQVYAAVTLALNDGLWAGGWLGPMLGRADYLNKPPMGFWLSWPWVAAVGGPGEPVRTLVAVRAASLVSLMVAAVATFGLWRTLAGRRIALVASVVFALTYEVFRYGRAFSLDAHLLMFVMLGMWGLVSGERAAADGRPGVGVRRAALAGLALGGGLLVKPFVALVVLPMVAVWMMLVRRVGWTSVPLTGSVLRLVVTGGVAVLVAAPWHVWMAVNVEDFVERCVFHQSVGRATGETFERDPVTLYARVIATSYWPWLIVIVFAGWVAFKSRLSKRAKRGGRAGERCAGVSASAALAGVVVVCWCVALSLIADKHPRYLLPVYPALSLLVAVGLMRTIPARVGASGWRRGALIGAVWSGPMGVALGVAGGLIAWVGAPIHSPPTEWKIELAAALEERNLLDRLWMTPDAARRAAYVYIYTGVAPRVLQPAVGEARATPASVAALAPGDAVLVRMRSRDEAALKEWRSVGDPIGEWGGVLLLVVTNADDRGGSPNPSPPSPGPPSGGGE